MQSFDSPLPDGRTVTAEHVSGPWWDLYLFTPDGLACLPLGRVSGSRDEAMRKADLYADAIALDKVTA